MRNKAILFEVWNECNNGCIFCSNKYVYLMSKDSKLHNLELLKKKLEDESTYANYNTIGLIGGEFFQGQLSDDAVKDKFFDCIKLINAKMNEQKLLQFWICCTLTTENQPDFYLFLKSIDDKKKLWICTSYDVEGRFHTKKLLENWQSHMHKMKQLYPDININVTTILTGSFIDKYLSGEFNVSEFLKRYNCTWFNKPPMIPSNCTLSKVEYNKKILSNFFPERKKFLKFLAKFKQNESSYEYDKLFNTQLRADALVKPSYLDENLLMVIKRDKQTDEEVTLDIQEADFIDGNGKIEDMHNDTSYGCKHNKAYSPYVDSDACFYCDKELIKEL